MSVMILDLETEYHKDLPHGSSPFNPDLFIVSAGWCIEEEAGQGELQGVFFGADVEGERGDWFTIPDDVDMIVGHNLTFDVQWLLNRKPEQMRAFFKRGGLLFDTQLAHYLLSGFQDRYPALNTIAPAYGGTPKADMMGVLWAQGMRTSEIPKEVQFDEYLMGDDPGDPENGVEPQYGDIRNTEIVFWGQVQQLVDQGMWQNALVRMRGLLFNILATYSGLHVDAELAYKQKVELAEEADRLNALTLETARTAVPEEAKADLKITAYTLSSILFGGFFSYNTRVQRTTASGAPMWEKDEVVIFQDGHQELYVDGVAVDELEKVHGPVNRYKAGKNKGQVKVEKVDSNRPATKVKAVSTTLEGLIPFATLPNTFREEMQCSIGKREFADGTPVLSTKSELLGALLNHVDADTPVHSLIQALVKVAAIEKDLGTYYLRETPKGTSGALQYLEEDNIIHHVLNGTSTVTGRLSSTRPNMQNIPRGDTSEVKKIYTSRFNDPVWLSKALARGEIREDVYQDCMDGLAAGEPRGRILECDFTALEVVTLACLSGDKNLSKALLGGTDMHCMRLAGILAEPYEEVLLKCKDPDHPEHAKYHKLRTGVKAPSFAYQYGATAHGISFSTGMSLEEAEAFVANEKALFPEVEEWYEKQVFPAVHNSRRMERRMDAEGNYAAVGIGEWRAPSGTRYVFTQYPKSKKDFQTGESYTVLEFKPTQMRNYPIQGESSLIVQTAAGEVAYQFCKRGWWGYAYIINQVHDSLGFDVYAPMLERVAKLAIRTMEAAPKLVQEYMGVDLPMPFPAVPEAGMSLYDKREMDRSDW